MTKKSNYVLVHGAWHGAWCWDRVARKLIERGARVFIPTLRGLGERAGEITPTPTLQDHVKDVIGMVACAAEYGPVVLVGHSYAGMLITAVGDRLGRSLSHLIYLDAAVPKDGDDFASHIPGLAPEDIARRRGVFTSMAVDGAWLPPPPAQMVGVTAPDDVAWLSEKLTPHPLQTWLEPVSLTGGKLDEIPKTYVLAVDPPTTFMGYPLHGENAKLTEGWSYAEIATGHDMMVTAPDEVVEVLLSVNRPV
jgi:pimeloyl-ACP methyl ester carboxylesterase